MRRRGLSTGNGFVIRFRWNQRWKLESVAGSRSGLKFSKEGKMRILCRKVESEKVLVIACARRSCFAGCFADTPKRRHTSERTHQRSCKAEQNNQQKRVSPDHGRFRKLVKCSIVPNHTIPDPAIAIDLLDHIQTQLQLVTSKLK